MRIAILVEGKTEKAFKPYLSRSCKPDWPARCRNWISCRTTGGFRRATS